MAPAIQVFEVTAREHDSTLFPGEFIKVTGPVPDWVIRTARPHDGAIPAGRRVFDVDVEAAARELAEGAARSAAATPREIKIEDVKKRFGFVSDEQVSLAIALLGFPAGRTVFDVREAGYETQVTGSHRLWWSNSLDRWEAAARIIFPASLPAKAKR